MNQRWLQSLAIVGLTAALLLCEASVSLAQIGDARGTNYGNMKKLFPELSDLIKNQNVEEAKKRADEFMQNAIVVRGKLENAGNRLHDADQNWLKSTSKQKAMAAISKLGTEAGILATELGKGDPSSRFSNVKSYWEEFTNVFDEFWKEYSTRMKEMEERAKRYRDDCGSC